jgi:uncharacterized coiled-coil protein SlyX
MTEWSAPMSDDTIQALPELWRNESGGIVQVKKFGSTGNLEPVLVQPKRTFQMRSDERRLNQLEVATAAQDPWTNGLLTNLSIAEDAEDVEKIRTSPHQLTDDDMRNLFAGAISELRAKVAEISNPVTLKRLWEVGVANAAKPAKAAVVEARVREVDPNADYLATQPAADPTVPPPSADAGDEEPPEPTPTPPGTRPTRA